MDASDLLPGNARDTKGGHVVGEVFGEKRLVEYAGYLPRHYQHFWHWECLACGGRYGPEALSHLRRKDRCVRCLTIGSANPRWVGHEQITGEFLGRYRRNARARGIEWAVEPAYLWQTWLAQDGRCAYTGWPLDLRVNASLDRIDNAVGYLPGNVQWLHIDVNRMKSDFRPDYFLLVCRAIAEQGR